MAGVLDFLASYFQSTLREIGAEEVNKLLGVSSDINRIDIKLRRLKNYAADADRRVITDQSVQEWVRDLMHAIYDAINILDLCHLLTMEQGRRHAIGCFNPLLFCIRNSVHAHIIRERIEKLTMRLDGIMDRSSSFNFINLGTFEDGGRNMVLSESATRETSGALDESGLVGEKIEEDTRNLVEVLTKKYRFQQEQKNITVFAIVGAGGIGKTTLAQKIFNNDIIAQCFEMKLWLSINKYFNGIDLLRRAITLAGYQTHELNLAASTKAELEQALIHVLRGRKTLLVMDDVWDDDAWESILKTPLTNALAPGSRVLLTTRKDTVAKRMKAEEPYHRVHKLNSEDAWSLLKKQVAINETDIPEIDMLADIGMEIVTKCDYFPLFVKVMGGLLREKNRRRVSWERLLNDFARSVYGTNEFLFYTMYLSYEELSSPLKQCFLHYSLLPDGVQFHVDTIISMWISGGIVHGNSYDLEILGREYYEELISRNLIELDTRYFDQSYSKMHGVVRLFGQYIARGGSLIANIGESDITSELNSLNFIQLSLYNNVSTSIKLEWSSLQLQKSLRTLVLVGSVKIKICDSLVYFPSLRMLHLCSTSCDGLVESLYQLKHLRYLTMEECDISILPDNIRKMKFLQHIDVSRNERLVKIPDTILELRQLRSLHLTGTSIFDVPRGFGVLDNLRRIQGFPSIIDRDWCSLEELGPLFNLTVLAIAGLEKVSSASLASRARIAEKMHLRTLRLSCSSRLGDDDQLKTEKEAAFDGQRIMEVFDKLRPPHTLENLWMEGYFGQQFPRWMMSGAEVHLKNLRFITMHGLCCTELPDGLCQLPCLEVLRIDNAPVVKRIGPEFQQSNCHNHSVVLAAFPSLCSLTFMGMVEWDNWEWEVQVQAMPKLEVFHLERCKLRHIPLGLVFHASALRQLYVHKVEQLVSLENLASVVHLEVSESPKLERIINLQKLQKLILVRCPNMKILEGVLALRTFTLEDYDMETLPRYLQDLNLRHMQLGCTLSLFTSIAAQESRAEWHKISHMHQVEVYTHEGDLTRKWVYTRDDSMFETSLVFSARTQEMGDLTSEDEVLEQSNMDHIEVLEQSNMDHIVLERILDGIEEPCNLKLPLLKLITDNFSFEHKVGRGGSGDVYKGTLKNRSVAVKRLFNRYTVDEKMFEQEVRSMMMVKHKNIVRFLGYCSDTQGHATQVEGKYIMAEERERLLCFEYISNGSLDNHITDELRGLEWNTRYQIIIGICEGLNYLHNEKGLIHMDLKPANILIDEHMVPKITDFGISRLDGKSYTMSTKRLGSLGYCAPEYINQGRMSNKSDIYSLGTVITEMVTGSTEKPNISKVLRRWKHRWNKSSEEVPSCYYEQVTKCLKLALLCTRVLPVDRPSISDIIHELKQIDATTGKIGQHNITLEQLRPSLEDMLGVKPLEIRFPFPIEKEISCLVELTNDTDDYIAFRITPMSNLLEYSTEPKKGIVQPQSKCCVKITLQPQEMAPIYDNNHLTREEFCVQSTRVHQHITTTDIADDMFNEELENMVDQVNLPVVFDIQK